MARAKHGTYSGLSNAERLKLSQRTKDGVATRMISDQRVSSKKRGHRPPEYTLRELRAWLNSQPLFHVLHKEWELSGHQKSLKPSIDRKCDDVHYCFNNIQLMTWGENKAKGERDRKSGKSVVNHKAVVKCDKRTGEILDEYPSINKAARDNNLSSTALGNCLTGYTNSSGGFIWEYKKD